MSVIPRLGSIIALDREAEQEEQKPLLSEIMELGVEQIEYYLSGANLEKDEWMRNQEATSPNHMIPISAFMGCGKIKSLGISADDLLFACSFSKFLKVDKENITIGRKEPFKQDKRRKFRTVRVNGFGQNISIELVYNAFAETVAAPTYITMQSTKTEEGDQIHTGVAYVEFSNEVEAERACKTSIYNSGQKIQVELIIEFEERVKKSF